ncbi:MAG TPA: FAD-binding oxidoreductase, partial [Vicinamibacterales bacterium]|nr:FAD-binding oxidoreductase [Vicinamibacterales bacterium]
LSIESIGLIERFADEVGHPVDFHQDGYLFLLSTPASVETFKRNVALQRGLGVDVRWLDAGEAARLAPGLNADGVIAATFCERDGIADPNGVTMGFAKAAQAMGVTVERDVEVTGIRVAAGRVAAVETTRGTLDTRIVVNAAGPYARSIGAMAGADVPVDPIRRHIFIAAPSTGSGQAGQKDARLGGVPPSHIMVIDFETTFYFHREGAGLLFGMGDPHETPTFDTTVQWDFLPQVIDVAVTRLPALADASISHAWAGLYEMSPDGNPIVGAADGVDGLYLINGFSGHGFQHSPAAGRILADVITGRDPHFDLSPFAAGRFARLAAGAGERYVV